MDSVAFGTARYPETLLSQLDGGRWPPREQLGRLLLRELELAQAAPSQLDEGSSYMSDRVNHIRLRLFQYLVDERKNAEAQALYESLPEKERMGDEFQRARIVLAAHQAKCRSCWLSFRRIPDTAPSPNTIAAAARQLRDGGDRASNRLLSSTSSISNGPGTSSPILISLHSRKRGSMPERSPARSNCCIVSLSSRPSLQQPRSAAGLLEKSDHPAEALPFLTTLANNLPWKPEYRLRLAKDFSALLKDWSGSEQQRAWLTSDNYEGFSRSRLFARLGEAQQQFAQSAGLPPDMNFLNQVAGKESLFAWYDIGNLEFLYITYLPADAAQQTSLFQERSKFEARQAGADTFYLRSTSGNEGSQTRTVAFATHGGYLLLATREDLIANALLLMQGQGNLDLQDEHWYKAATAAASGPAGDLRMTLNLAAIVPSPYFRSYWVQRNITEMKRYNVAESDLYRTPESFREERVLLPKSPEQVAKAADVAPVLQYLPTPAGVYRVTAHPTTERIVAALGEKLLFRDIAAFRDSRIAPVADLSLPNVGSATDFETRIDIPPPPTQLLNMALTPLRSLLDAAQVDAMLVTSSAGSVGTGDRANGGGSGQVFVPIRSAVVLSASASWNAEALRTALTEALRARFTAGDNGLSWKPRTRGSLTWFEQQGLQPLAFAVEGNVCVFASDSDTLLRSLAMVKDKNTPQELATIASGFDHTAERPQFARIVEVLDRRSQGQQPPDRQTTGSPQRADEQTPVGDGPPNGETPEFFSGNIRSLSDTFKALDSETFLERPDLKTNVVRQTVVYQWKH